MTDYSELVKQLRENGNISPLLLKGAEKFERYWFYETLPPKFVEEAADAIEAQAKQIADLEHQLKVECDTYLWNRKRMSRHIAMLEYWMERLFKYGSSPEAKRNELTMATEIPDYLMKEGENILNHLEERSDATRKVLEEK